MQKNKRIRKNVCVVLFCVLVLFLLLYELVLKNKLFLGIGAWEKGMVDMLITRTVGGAIFLVFTIYLGYRVLNPISRPIWKNFLFVLPALIIAVNNLPIIPLICGQSEITAGYDKIFLLLFECLAIGFFEEMAFRSVVMLGIMENRGNTKKGILISILLSAAVFGLVHILNMFISPSPMVILQIMYSALIGAMCSVVLLLTRNIWVCVIIHGLFNFFGAIVSECGKGRGFFDDPPTQILTAVISLAVIAIYVRIFVSLDVNGIKKLYPQKEESVL